MSFQPKKILTQQNYFPLSLSFLAGYAVKAAENYQTLEEAACLTCHHTKPQAGIKLNTNSSKFTGKY